MMYFAFLLLVGVVVSATAFDMKDPELLKKAEECATETGIDLKAMEKIPHGDREAWKKLFENHDYRCHTKCMAMKMGLMNDKGEPDIPKIKETFDFTDEAKIKILTECIEKNHQEDLCDRSYEVQHCVWSDIMKNKE